MRLPEIAQLLTDDPGPFATAYADVSRVAEAGDDAVALTARAAHDELVAAGAPAAVAEAVRDALGASTHEGGEVARVVVASERGVRHVALVRGRRPQPSTSWGALPDLGPWLEDATLVTPFVLARVDHEGGSVATYADAAAAPDHEAEATGGDPNFLHKAGGGGMSYGRHEHSVEEEWKRSADAVAEEVERQVRVGPSLVLVGGEPDAVSELKAKLAHVEAEVVELQGGRRNADGGEEAFAAEITQALRGRAVSASLDALEELKQRLGEQAQGKSARAASGVHDVLDALVRGQVDTLLIDVRAAAETSVTPADQPGLDLGAVVTLDAVPADQVLLALAALTGADVRAARRSTLGGEPVAAVLRWDNTAEPEAPSASR
ncbi:baeRF2 domain-containing protein [Microlunatus flavus]|uniref:Peptide chain release factor 1 (ERF1) n=1 Tax=Microlunatus flavus TaxID=1036181 RepID=A0A1H8ZJG9_9ACTN|nr:Vms1/Ankzf1 family peptidyl-tRNA hydrolase [Microlunatus flavus]SEP64484.1 hypothetical protein SAMN05421756_101266 [Microlunatus flavus]